MTHPSRRAREAYWLNARDEELEVVAQALVVGHQRAHVFRQRVDVYLRVPVALQIVDERRVDLRRLSLPVPLPFTFILST